MRLCPLKSSTISFSTVAATSFLMSSRSISSGFVLKLCSFSNTRPPQIFFSSSIKAAVNSGCHCFLYFPFRFVPLSFRNSIITHCIFLQPSSFSPAFLHHLYAGIFIQYFLNLLPCVNTQIFIFLICFPQSFQNLAALHSGLQKFSANFPAVAEILMDAFKKADFPAGIVNFPCWLGKHVTPKSIVFCHCFFQHFLFPLWAFPAFC